MLSELFARQMTKTKVSRMCYRPNLEALEDRVVPSTDTWTGAGGTINWSNPANWDTGHAPAAGDDLILSQDSTNDLTPGMIIHSITISGGAIQGNAIVLTGGMQNPTSQYGSRATIKLNRITAAANQVFMGGLDISSALDCFGFNLTF